MKNISERELNPEERNFAIDRTDHGTTEEHPKRFGKDVMDVALGETSDENIPTEESDSNLDTSEEGSHSKLEVRRAEAIIQAIKVIEEGEDPNKVVDSLLDSGIFKRQKDNPNRIVYKDEPSQMLQMLRETIGPQKSLESISKRAKEIISNAVAKTNVEETMEESEARTAKKTFNEVRETERKDIREESEIGSERESDEIYDEFERKNERHKQIEKRGLTPEEIEIMALERVEGSKLGKELNEFIKAQEKIQPPVKIGFFRRVGMSIFDRKGLEIYTEKNERYKIAQEKLRKAYASKEAWISKESMLIVEAEKVNGELAEFTKKIESGVMTKRDWKRVEKITSKLAIIRDSTDRNLIEGIKTNKDFGFKSEIPKREDWEGFKKSKEFNKNVKEIKLSIIEGMKGQLSDAESYNETDTNSFRGLQRLVGSNPELKSRLADLSSEWQEKFFKEQAGECLHQIAEVIAKQESFLVFISKGDSLATLIDNPQVLFQVVGAVRSNSIDVDRGWNSIDRSLDRYSKAESLQSLGRGIKARLKQEFAERIAGIGPNFEIEFDTAVTDILKNGTSRTASVARGIREYGGAFQIMGNRTKYGLKYIQEKAISFVDRHFTLEGRYSQEITDLNNDLAELNRRRDAVNEILFDVIGAGLNAQAEMNLNDSERQSQIDDVIREQRKQREERQGHIMAAIQAQMLRRVLKEEQYARDREEAEEINGNIDAINERLDQIEESNKRAGEELTERVARDHDRADSENLDFNRQRSATEASELMDQVVDADHERAILDSSVREIIIGISPSLEKRESLIRLYESEGGLTADFIDELSIEAQLQRLRIERARSDIQEKIADMEADLSLEREKLAKSLDIAAEEVSGDFEHELEYVVEDLRKIDLAAEDKIDQIYDQVEEEIEKLRAVFEEKIFDDLKREILP